MFKLDEKFEVDWKILKWGYIRYSLAETSTIYRPNSQKYINKPKEKSVNFLLNSCPDMNFEVVKKTDGSRSANGNDTRLVIWDGLRYSVVLNWQRLVAIT